MTGHHHLNLPNRNREPINSPAFSAMIQTHMDVRSLAVSKMGMCLEIEIFGAGVFRLFAIGIFKIKLPEKC